MQVFFGLSTGKRKKKKRSYSIRYQKSLSSKLRGTWNNYRQLHSISENCLLAPRPSRIQVLPPNFFPTIYFARQTMSKAEEVLHFQTAML